MTPCAASSGVADEIRALPSVIELIAPDQRESLRETLSHRFRADAPQGGLVEAALMHKAGHDVEVELGVKRKATGRVVLVVRDVTDRKALERERADQRARLETVLRILPVGMSSRKRRAASSSSATRKPTPVGAPMDALSVEGYGVYEAYWPDGRRVAPTNGRCARGASRSDAAGERCTSSARTGREGSPS